MRHRERSSPSQIAVPDAAEGQVVGKIRGEAHGGPVTRNRLQPFRRTLDERLGREQHDRARRIQRPERHADEAHVMMQRQPAHGGIRRRGREPGGTVDGVDVRAHIAVRQGDASRRGGRPGRELDERDVVERRTRLRFERRRVEIIARQHDRQIRIARSQAFEPGDERGARDDGAGAGRAEDSGGELEISRRIPRHAGGATEAGTSPAIDAPNKAVRNCSGPLMTSATRSPRVRPACRSAPATRKDACRRSA